MRYHSLSLSQVLFRVLLLWRLQCIKVTSFEHQGISNHQQLHFGVFWEFLLQPLSTDNKILVFSTYISGVHSLLLLLKNISMIDICMYLLLRCFCMCLWPTYRETSNIRHPIPNFSDSRVVLQLSLANPLKPGVKLRMKMQLEQCRQAMLQLHLSDQQFYCLLRCV